MESIDRVYIINLERRKDRLDHFWKEVHRELTPSDIEKIEVFRAIDAMTHVFTEDEKKWFEKSNLNNIDDDTRRGCMANQLGHYYILMDIIKNGYKNCLIFQDDVRFKKGFRADFDNVVKNMPENSEIIWIGLHKTAAGSFFVDYPIDEACDLDQTNKKLNPHILELSDDVNPCSLAYLVTQNGARNFVDYMKHLGTFVEATDTNFNKYLREKKLMYCSFPVLCTGNSNFKSDIFKHDDNAFARDALEILELL
jgi:GR25 family glycosyltransferase involved in LPS biosynthesis